MSLSERLAERRETIHGKPCSVGVLIDSLEGDELAALRVMLGTPDARGWSEGEIYDAVTAEGHTIARQSINRHRGGRCRCAQDES